MTNSTEAATHIIIKLSQSVCTCNLINQRLRERGDLRCWRELWLLRSRSSLDDLRLLLRS